MNGHSAVADESSTGEAASQADFVRKHGRRLALFIKRRVGDPRSMQEIEQETWAAHLRRWTEHLDRPAALFGIASNLIKDWYAQRGLEISFAPDAIGGVLEVLPPQQRRPRDPGDSVPMSVDLGKAMKRLSKRHREVMVLKCVDDLAVKEIAAVLGIGAGTVKEYLAEARIALRKNPDLAGYETGRTVTTEVTT
jgi:RNA polymerase sigma-70 factor, ECF subfamily